jgi:hypothetical protein
MQIFYPPLNFIIRLLVSKSAGPKVIIISGFHCIIHSDVLLEHKYSCPYV